MLRAWRLAISTLSARRSRSLLLIATVALSAALITAVSGTMHSMQVSARRQAEQTVGAADIRIKPTAVGKSIDASLLDIARGWPGVVETQGRLEAPVQLTAQLEVMAGVDGAWVKTTRPFAHRVMANGLAPFDGARLPQLVEGRAPTAPGEIAVDATLMVRMSFAGKAAATPMQLPKRNRGQREHLIGPHPVLPDKSDEAAAAALNKQVGVRLNDTVQAARRVLPEFNVGAVLANPTRAAEMARAAGLGSSGLLADANAKSLPLKIVGVIKPPPFGGRPRAFMPLATLAAVTGSDQSLSIIELTLAPGTDPEAFVREHAGHLPDGVMMQTGAKVTAGLDREIESSRLGLMLASVMAFLCASFIIMTAMTTGVTERLRELGVLRCIGADKGQLAITQLLGGGMVGAFGAFAGLPLGLAIGWGIIRLLQRQVEVDLHIPGWGLVMAGSGALLSGLLGSAVPAFMAARVTPLEALAARAAAPRPRGLGLTLLLGLAFVALQLGVITLTTDGQSRFWGYVFVGLPASFLGFFLLAVPVTVGITRLTAGPLSRLLRLPPHVLSRTVRATPYRHGFTAGSMMMGLALMVGIWTQGGAIQRDWLDTFQFPDAFVTGLNLDSSSVESIRRMEGVTDVCAITLQSVETDAFGVRALQKFRSTFMAFEPEPFFKMVKPIWVEGDPAVAIPKLEAGGAVIVAREFQVARGVKVGDTFTCRANGKQFSFEIVGVVTSPGLEVISQFFAIGDDFTQQSLNAVFGSRKDLKAKFGSDAVHLVQIALRPDVDDRAFVEKLREDLAPAGILDAGSGKRIKSQITEFIGSALFAASFIAIIAMLIAGFGVANLIVAGINARQFEFGVLRAVGAGPWLIARLVLGEAIIVGLAASALGTWMGLQGTYCVQRIDEKLFGFVLKLRPPLTPLAWGWTATIAMTLLAAAPAIIALGRRRPRELLGAVKG